MLLGVNWLKKLADDEIFILIIIIHIPKKLRFSYFLYQLLVFIFFLKRSSKFLIMCLRIHPATYPCDLNESFWYCNKQSPPKSTVKFPPLFLPDNLKLDCDIN